MEIARIDILPEAKMLLHAIEHPNSQIGGILLGKGGHVNDVLPVCHDAPTKPLAADRAIHHGTQRGRGADIDRHR